MDPAGPQNSRKTLAPSTWRRPSGLPRPRLIGVLVGRALMVRLNQTGVRTRYERIGPRIAAHSEFPLPESGILPAEGETCFETSSSPAFCALGGRRAGPESELRLAGLQSPGWFESRDSERQPGIHLARRSRPGIAHRVRTPRRSTFHRRDGRPQSRRLVDHSRTESDA